MLFEDFESQNSVEKKTVTAPFFYKKMVLSQFFFGAKPGEKRGKKNCDSTIFYKKHGAVTVFFSEAVQF